MYLVRIRFLFDVQNPTRLNFASPDPNPIGPDWVKVFRTAHARLAELTIFMQSGNNNVCKWMTSKGYSVLSFLCPPKMPACPEHGKILGPLPNVRLIYFSHFYVRPMPAQFFFFLIFMPARYKIILNFQRLKSWIQEEVNYFT